MNLPKDITEGWWWCHGKDGFSAVIHVRHEILGWAISYVNEPLSSVLPDITAMERVAPPSWESPGKHKLDR